MKPKLPMAYYGAAFLMATSAIGPGFLTSTALFTYTLVASFGFAILISVIVDLVAQMNVWRIITATNMRAQDIANQLLPGLGGFLSLLVIAGGLVFNIGNIAGCGLGLNVLFGIDVVTGALISAAVSIGLFLVRDAGKAMDWFVQVLGFVMIGLTLYVAFSAHPPLGEALHRSLLPERLDFKIIVILVGGTVGGYITFAGAHRLLDAGISGVDKLKQVDKSAMSAIGLASLMRFLLFLAALGVLTLGAPLDAGNPAAGIFRAAAGEWGYKIFGLVLWAAAVSSVVGASFTSVTFAQSVHPLVTRYKNYGIIAFIAVAALFFAFFGKPVKVLIFAGAFNGWILAFSLGIMLLASTKSRIMKDYRHPRVLQVSGIIVALLMFFLGFWTVMDEIARLF